MLEKLANMPEGIDGVKASGKVTKEEYEAVVEPLIDAARRENRRIRLLYQVAPDFQGLAPAAVWEDTKVGLSSLKLFDGCAVVTDIGWIRELSRLGSFLVSCPTRVFGNDELGEATDWLSSLPQGPGVSHHLDSETGVVVVEVQQPLRVQDFDALAVTVDTWLERQGDLHGLVVHAREFPGWQNFPSLLRHMKFVRDHHRRIGRVALAADSKLAELVPHLAKHFVQAEVNRFGYDDLDEAIAWAAGTRQASS
ncbi:SpoIIAA-like protein [Saccharopolyspora erythraea NRRL 2338]|uniref:Uncharacterized protein n=2 Tax=Saccharopolyspora erythraea TaxID=1836 RepID=A4FCH9_SACEN|nr:STAS/SEC14 domain-containing protein [Saccharopolyspora erythraea]PFG95517.1 SpoIIAA-like protein [Saccharopolyspora erythraea NRRL 2338]CAM01754.1 hypothetical protein SACE_2456 [Saccharopolyspora erythraea NRRL 2338]